MVSKLLLSCMVSVKKKQPNKLNQPKPNYSVSSHIRRYELSDGTKQFEIGYTRYTSDGTPYQVVEGYYIYKTPDDKWVRVAYFADKDGYKVIDSKYDTYMYKISFHCSRFSVQFTLGPQENKKLINCLNNF